MKLKAWHTYGRTLWMHVFFRNDLGASPSKNCYYGFNNVTVGKCRYETERLIGVSVTKHVKISQHSAQAINTGSHSHEAGALEDTPARETRDGGEVLKGTGPLSPLEAYSLISACYKTHNYSELRQHNNDEQLPMRAEYTRDMIKDVTKLWQKNERVAADI